MTPFDAAQTAVMSALAPVAGEPLSYLGGTVVVIVDRKMLSRGRDWIAQMREYIGDFDPISLVQIEVTKASIALPQVGQVLSNSTDRYRIRYVEEGDVTWRLFCTMSRI